MSAQTTPFWGRLLYQSVDFAVLLGLALAGAGWWALIVIPYALWQHADGLNEGVRMRDARPPGAIARRLAAAVHGLLINWPSPVRPGDSPAVDEANYALCAYEDVYGPACPVDLTLLKDFEPQSATSR
jgi:hypothetical protein